MKTYLAAGAALAVQLATVIATSEHEQEQALQKRQFEDSYKIYLRKRNAHSCMMSIVFIVLLPLGAISLHLPLRGIRVVPFIHAPIQLLGLAMVIGALGLGIDLAKNDLHYFSPVQAHVVIGLLATCTLILFQPALGFWQHRHYRRTGQKSVISYIHRWLGRVAICLGWINSGLGFQLVGIEITATHILVREYVILGIIGGLWFFLVGLDGLRSHWLKRQKMSAFALRWERGPRFRTDEGEKEALEAANNNELGPGAAPPSSRPRP